MTISKAVMQELMAYAAIVMSVLTQTVPSITTPAVASAILGVFGILLHPQTSVSATVSAIDSAIHPQTQQQQKISGV